MAAPLLRRAAARASAPPMIAMTPPALLEADLDDDAAAEWDGAIATGPTGMEQPAYATTRALLLEMRRQTEAIAAMSRAIGSVARWAALLALLLLGGLLALLVYVVVR